jgi:hypothetical protein
LKMSSRTMHNLFLLFLDNLAVVILSRFSIHLFKRRVITLVHVEITLATVLVHGEITPQTVFILNCLLWSSIIIGGGGGLKIQNEVILPFMNFVH